MPHSAADPVPVAAEIVLALQSMVTRRVDVFDPAVVTVAHLSAGSTSNVIPDTAFLEGTIRTLSAERRRDVVAAVERVATHVAAAHDMTLNWEHIAGYPVTVNDPGAAARVLGAAAELLGERASCVSPAPLMGAEDFSYVLATRALRRAAREREQLDLSNLRVVLNGAEPISAETQRAFVERWLFFAQARHVVTLYY